MEQVEYIKVSFSLPKRTMERLRELTEERHGRVERFMSATLDQIINAEYERRQREQKEATGR